MGRNWFDSGYDSLQDGYVGGRKVEVVGHETGGVNHYAYVDERTSETHYSPHTETHTAAHQQQRHYQRSTHSTRMRSAQNVHRATRRKSEVEDLEAQAAKEAYYKQQQEYHRAAANHARAILAEGAPGYGQTDRRVSNASLNSNSSPSSSKGKGIAKDVGYLVRSKSHAVTVPKVPDKVYLPYRPPSAAEVSKPM